MSTAPVARSTAARPGPYVGPVSAGPGSTASRPGRPGLGPGAAPEWHDARRSGGKRELISEAALANARLPADQDEVAAARDGLTEEGASLPSSRSRPTKIDPCSSSIAGPPSPTRIAAGSHPPETAERTTCSLRRSDRPAHMERSFRPLSRLLFQSGAQRRGRVRRQDRHGRRSSANRCRSPRQASAGLRSAERGRAHRTGIGHHRRPGIEPRSCQETSAPPNGSHFARKSAPNGSSRRQPLARLPGWTIVQASAPSVADRGSAGPSAHLTLGRYPPASTTRVRPSAS